MQHWLWAADPNFLLQQEPSTELLLQMAKILQDEISDHNASKRMLNVEIEQRRQAEEALWQSLLQGAKQSQSFENERKAVKSWKSQASQAQRQLFHATIQNVTLPVNIEWDQAGG